MDERKSSGLNTWTPLLFSLLLIIGMVLGFNLRDSLRNKRDIQAIIDRNDRLEQIIDLINEKYVDSVNSNLLFDDAIAGILSHLDPHTVYISANDLQSISEDMEGSFVGIGVEFSIVRDTIQVTSVIDGGPAQRAGINLGDKLIKVDDSIVAGRKISSATIIKMLRGKMHSKVFVTILSIENAAEKKLLIQRDAIPLYSLDVSLMLDEASHIGYMKLNRFSATTYDEFKTALTALKKKGMQSLVLDLRGNPGGYLDAATKIAGEFLGSDKLIVYTEGKHSPRTEYKAENNGEFEKGKLVILIDESSASASEILSGATQDWDRGILVGQRSYGKGLVQDQFDLANGAALRLTVARYYTPSGRCIQRPYAKGKENYVEEISSRFHGSRNDNDSFAKADTTKYFTQNKRVVYGGGGISPDVYVPRDTAFFSVPLFNLIFNDTTRLFVWEYFLANKKSLAQYQSATDFAKHFDGAQLSQMYVATLSPKWREQYRTIMKKPASKEYFELQLKARLARFMFHDEGFYSVINPYDKVIKRALYLLNHDQYSKIISR
ncbi:MAG: S41 family peptidase [Bacteroidetes bacterium]|nr:S41 family peptidase [Bacteroidota bacterium]